MNVTQLPTPDRVWFRKHPDRNVKIRLPARGEIEEICRRSVHGMGYAIAQIGLPPLPDDTEYRVAVIDEGGHTLLRMVTMAPVDSPLEIDGAHGASTLALLLGARVAIDRRAG